MFRTRHRTLAAALLSVLAVACGGGESAGPTAPPTPSPTPAPIPDALRSVSLSPASESLPVGSTRTLTPTPDRASASVTVTYSYTSSAPAVATVSGAGEVTAVAAGNATIIVSAVGSGAGFSSSTRMATTSIVVVTPPAVTSFTLDRDSVDVVVGGEVRVNVSVGQPANATRATLALLNFVGAPAMGSIGDGYVTVTGMSPGTTSIVVSATAPSTSAFAFGSLQRTIRVRVLPAPSGVSAQTSAGTRVR